MTGILGVKKASFFTNSKFSPRASASKRKSSDEPQGGKSREQAQTIDAANKKHQQVTQFNQMNMLDSGFKLTQSAAQGRNATGAFTAT